MNTSTLLPPLSAMHVQADKTVRIWDMETGAAVKTLRGHTSHVTCVMWVPGSNTRLVSCEQGTSQARKGFVVFFSIDLGMQAMCHVCHACASAPTCSLSRVNCIAYMCVRGVTSVVDCFCVLWCWCGCLAPTRSVPRVM